MTGSEQRPAGPGDAVAQLDQWAGAYADEIAAALELVRRTGARGLELGYRDDAVLPGRILWFAYAQYAGERVTVDHHRGPAGALEALARQMLTGARCPHCGGLVAFPTADAILDGDATEEQLPATLRCHYRREGERWVRGCEPVHRPRKPKRHRRKPPRR